MTRNRSSLLAGIAIALLLASPARADHPVGAPVYSDEVGPYLIEARAGVTGASGEQFVEYSVAVQDAETSERVQDASVTATATTSEGERGPLELGGLGDAWVIVIPIERDEAIEWTMDVRVESSLGEARFQHPLRLGLEGSGDGGSAGPDGDGAATLPIVGGVTAAVVLAVVLLVRLRRRGETAGG